jgi:hypothetical protein
MTPRTDQYLDLPALQDQARVKIVRKRGRIAGFAAPSVPVDILWCGTNRPRRKYGNRRNGWSFPPAVRELLLQETQGLTVAHLFGGAADFGLRMDIDPATKPHVVGDAFLPPFPRDFCDVVVLDPPYQQLKAQEKMALMWAAGWIARQYVYWFSTVWIATDRSLPLVHAWLIRVGDQWAVRCLQKFEVREPKRTPLKPGEFTRGPALFYNRWQLQHPRLPFSEVPPDWQIAPPPAKGMPKEGITVCIWAIGGNGEN